MAANSTEYLLRIDFNNPFNSSVSDIENLRAKNVDVLISARVMRLVDIYLHCILCGIVGLFGTASNVVNMVIFHRVGVKDSMSVGLMGLSASDTISSFIIMVAPALIGWNLLSPQNSIDPLAVHYVTIGWWRDIFFLSSCWITTYLSIERCVCVVFPFRVKDIFTKSKAIFAMIVICIVNIGFHMPVLVTMWLEWSKVTVHTNNGTVLKDRLVVKYSKDRSKVMLYIDIANGAIIPIPSQAVVLISVLWMIVGLKASSRIRKTNTISNIEDDQKKKQSNLSLKERRLIKLVLLIAIILIICNIPRFLAIYAHQIYPAAHFRNPEEHLYAFLWVFAVFSNAINCSVNICVYLSLNRSYRQTFKELFGICYKYKSFTQQ